jgi:hypothetical protein
MTGRRIRNHRSIPEFDNDHPACSCPPDDRFPREGAKPITGGIAAGKVGI